MTRQYTRNAAVARKIQARKVMTRAWEISKNAHNAHNANWMRVVDYGVSLNATDFFTSALKLAWVEELSNKLVYSKVSKLPKKSMQRIHSELRNKHFNLLFSLGNGFVTKQEIKLLLGNTALISRYGESRVTDEMISELKKYVLNKELKVNTLAA
jgi:hypothetical protein